MKTAIGCYVRVSTSGQNESGQRREIERWATGNGIDPANIRWYVDKKSGDNLDRPAFQEL
jgi:DNA invertase Pin-like site-specific DNA recombinase